MRAPIRDVISRLQGLPLANAGFHDNNRPDTDMRENKCQWLFGGNTLCRLSYTAHLLTKIRQTHKYNSLLRPSALSALMRAVHSQQRKRLFPSPHFSCVHIFLLCKCRDRGWRRGPLGPHHRLLTDQECFLLLHHRRVVMKGFVIFFFYFWASVVLFSPDSHRQVHRLSQ